MHEQPRILIAEDDAMTALDLQTLMMDIGLAVCGLASTAARAVALADYHRPDLALVDIHLARGTSGLDAAREMRRDLRVDVILLVDPRYGTGDLDAVDLEGPVFSKPVDPETLQRTVTQMLQGRVPRRGERTRLDVRPTFNLRPRTLPLQARPLSLPAPA